MNYGV